MLKPNKDYLGLKGVNPLSPPSTRHTYRLSVDRTTLRTPFDPTCTGEDSQWWPPRNKRSCSVWPPQKNRVFPSRHWHRWRVEFILESCEGGVCPVSDLSERGWVVEGYENVCHRLYSQKGRPPSTHFKDGGHWRVHIKSLTCPRSQVCPPRLRKSLHLPESKTSLDKTPPTLWRKIYTET